MVLKNLFIGQQWRNRHREQTYGHGEREGEGEMDGRGTWKLTLPYALSDSVRPHRRQPTRLPRPWDSPGKNTGLGCHFLLQCMKVKSESEVTQSCLTLRDPVDCSLPGSSVHGISQARVLEWGAIAFCKIDSQQEFAVWLRKLKQGLCINLGGEMGREMGGRFKREGIYVYLWLIHVEV